jgi:23S rRNA (cytidine1920-2'-O)/16S rRNA (cytidine1409-2'-O)-methyltransferase
MAGRVSTAGRRVEKAGERLRSDAVLQIREVSRFVSRGGEKLDAALDVFATIARDRVCLDAGASTGGFTDCLLSRGALRVYAVDVGYGQLAWSLRSDSRVVALERTNVRSLARSALNPPPTLVTADLSFVPLRSMLPALAELAGPSGELVLLVKPQFELTPSEVVGGIVTDPALRARAVDSVKAACAALRLDVRGTFESPLPGRDGNVELFVAALCPPSDPLR